MDQIAPDARSEQIQASDPALSAFVSAHAGAGKTTLLIERLLRLMLAGADPARILCLTYTKAGAAEMSIRLQQRLGDLVALSDSQLDDRLHSLRIARTPEARARARALFAEVLDLPGGMRIHTIHAFCQGLLRRFPLEAQISPHFQLMEEPGTCAALDAATEAAIPMASPAALAELAGLVGAADFSVLLQALTRRRGRLAPALARPREALEGAVRVACGCTHASYAETLEEALAWPGEAALRRELEHAAAEGTAGVVAKASEMLAWLALPPVSRRANWEAWLCHLFKEKGSGGPRAATTYCNQKLAVKYPDIAGVCAAEQERADAVRQQCAAHRAAAATLALLDLAAPALGSYETVKSGADLDYDDLIERTAALLRDPGTGWVLYKLDGGLDHLLLDEVQDTAPAQWQIAADLTAEFFAGAGARDATPRTLFAVGDYKQSIFSFQGAEPAGFERWRQHFGRRATDAGTIWRETTLEASFRSTAPVLQLVDAVFSDQAACAGIGAPGTLSHLLRRQGQAGCVELWPLAPRPDRPDTDPWTPPTCNRPRDSARQRLVAALADWIAAELERGTMLPSAGRRLHAGDILILVQTRNEVPRGLVGALKSRGVKVAGLDRMKLAEQPAVRDLVSLAEALLLPEDELRFAEYLTSPLGGLDDPSLMALAAGRTAPLADTLRGRAAERADWRAAWDFFAQLQRRVDFASPAALLAEALGPLGGRARLLRRLGPEAAEPIDELLHAAARHEATHPPSLQGFLHWLDRTGAEIVREAEAAGDAVRIMTVHGAKGLEAPLVILPDTVAAPRGEKNLFWPEHGDLPLWAPNASCGGPALRQARAREAARCTEEYNRLLYVALTRARDRLVICGAAMKAHPSACWYELVKRGMERAGAATFPFLRGDWGEGLRLDCAQTAAPDRTAVAGTRMPDPPPGWFGRAPDWHHAPPPAEPPRPLPLAPSRPDGVEHGSPPPARSPLAAAAPDRLARGRQIHALLQHLPQLAPAEREGAARAFAGAAIAREVLAVLEDPALAPLFGPGSRAEQPVCGVIGDRVITGRVDRLCLEPGRVRIADYKTGAEPPRSPEAVPVSWLRQMAAYRALLRRLYPEREVECFLVFTDGPAVLTLPGALLDTVAPGAQA